jgi:hypothetical protein
MLHIFITLTAVLGTDKRGYKGGDVENLHVQPFVQSLHPGKNLT